jgi:dTDP-4-dehydrorhamnose reductase
VEQPRGALPLAGRGDPGGLNVMRIVVTGAKGQLGVELMRCLAEGGEVLGVDLPELDITAATCADALTALRPDWIVHAAALTDVDRCEREPDAAMTVNARGTHRVAEACRRAGAGLVYLSTDYVFDGTKGAPYLEEDPPNPLNAYGRSKLEGERACAIAPRSAIVRTAWLYGSHGKNFVRTIREQAAAGGPLRVVDDQVGSPTYATDLAQAIACLLARELRGVFHLTNAGACSWYEFAGAILLLTGQTGVPLRRLTSAELNRPARRPAFSVLENAAWRKAGLPPLRPWQEALAAMLAVSPAVSGLRRCAPS